MRIHYNIVRFTIVALVVTLAAGCRHDKKTSDVISQQQDFPKRELNMSVNNTVVKDRVVKEDIIDSIVSQAAKADIPVAVAHNHRSHSSGGGLTHPDPKTADELEVEYEDVFGSSYLDHIDDDEYDEAEQYDDNYYADRWERMPQQVVSNRPVKPRGQFRRFEPQQ